MIAKTSPDPARRRRRGAGLCTLLVAGPLLASIAPSPVGAQPLWVDLNEGLFGPTNMSAAIGNGHLSAGISERGELTVLRWPTPSIHDQLFYRATDRNAPRMGAPEGHGSFAGVRVIDPDGGERLHWLRDPGWGVRQRYTAPTDNVLVSEHVATDLGLEVVQTDAIDPDADVLVRRYELTRAPAGAKVHLVYYENFAPTSAHLEGVPVLDWMLDGLNDFLCLFHSGSQSLIHLRPAVAVPPPTGWVLRGTDPADPPSVDTLVETLDDRLAEGVFLALGAGEPLVRSWVGQDAGVVEGSTTDALAAARAGASGSLVGERAANAYVETELVPGRPVDVFVAAAPTAAGARSLLEAARRDGGEAVVARSQAWWREWVGRARLPPVDDPATVAMLQRILITIRTAYHPETGSIVASISGQPPYAEDWTRDGAFANLILDLAGYRDMVERHDRFFLTLQHREDTYARLPFAGAAGTWGANYYTDGVEGLPPFLFELDATPYAMWGLAMHAHFLDDPRERRAWLEEVYPSIRFAAETLLACRDPTNGLECRYFLEGPPQFAQDLYGGVMLWLGLDTAHRVGAALGEDPAFLRRLDERKVELEAAMLDAFGDGAGGLDEVPFYLPFPPNFIPLDDPRMQVAADTAEETLEAFFERRADEGIQIGWISFVLGLLRGDDPAMRSRLEAWHRAMVQEVAHPGTGHYGESWYVFDRDGDGEREHWMRVGIPQIWQSANVYLSIAGLADRESLEPVLRNEYPVAPAGDGGCSCESRVAGPDGPDGPRSADGALVLLGALVGARARRGSARGRTRPGC